MNLPTLLVVSFITLPPNDLQQDDLTSQKDRIEVVKELFSSLRGKAIDFETYKGDRDVPIGTQQAKIGNGHEGRFSRTYGPLPQFKSGDVIRIDEHILHDDGMYLKSFDSRLADDPDQQRSPVSVSAKLDWKTDDIFLVETILWGMIWDGEMYRDISSDAFWSSSEIELPNNSTLKVKVEARSEFIFEFLGSDNLRLKTVTINYVDNQPAETSWGLATQQLEFEYKGDSIEFPDWTSRLVYNTKDGVAESFETHRITDSGIWVPSDDDGLEFSKIKVPNGTEVRLRSDKTAKLRYQDGRFEEVGS